MKNSMPKKPIMKSERWTKRDVEKVDGRWVIVGYNDSGPLIGIAAAEQWDESGIWQVNLLLFNKRVDLVNNEIDAPCQVIAIGEKVYPPDDLLEQMPRRRR